MIPHLSERALIVAPQGRDAELAASILHEAGIRSHVCETIDALVAEAEAGAGFGVLTEEAVRTADLRQMSQWIDGQPEWSDFPFVLLTGKGGGIERNPAAGRFLEVLGNVTFLERPFHPTTFVSIARAALRGRRRQYDARARLAELHAGAARYRSLFDSIEAGFCIVEMMFDGEGRAVDYRFIEANPAFERQTRLRDAIGRTARELVPGLEQHWIDTYGEVARTGRSVRFENHAAALNDTWYEVHAFAAEESGPDRVAILFNDVSERRRMQDALRQLNETLEERVEQRTAELVSTQDQLRQAQKLEAIGQLTGGVAHDFNNLLMAVMSSLTLLRKRVPDDPALHQLIDNGLQGAERGAALTQRMLAFARRQDLASERIELAALVGGMTGLLEQTLGPRYPLKLALEPGLPPVLGDANQVEMALINLVVNARDAMDGGGEVRIETRERTVGAADGEPDGLTPGRYIGLSVTDTGHGMDAETLARATEPFFTTKGIGKGTGLGLPMIHGLAKQLGGTFRLHSQPGEGTTATLWLPAADADDIPALPTARPVAPPPAARRLKVLAVDDDVLVLMNTSALLADLGHEVLEAYSGEDALQLIGDHSDIDLLITDQAMPGMTGAELVEQVTTSRPGLPIILATGYGELPPGFRRSVIKLTKPFGQDVLRGAVAQALAQALAQAAAHAGAAGDGAA